MTAIWQALVVALVSAAAIQALLPPRWIGQALTGRAATVRGGLMSLPSMMCTCCTAPVAVTLRRRGASTAGALAYWVGNPLLNPAVLVFLALLLPWPWVATRVLVGALVVFGATVLVARLATGGASDACAAVPDAEDLPLREAPVRFVKALARMAVTLVPEYLVLVFAVGLLRGWLFPFDVDGAHVAVLAVIVAAVAGTLVVIPTAGERPVVLALLAASVSPAIAGALLITLPAVSLPSMAMVAGALSWRVTLAMAGTVAVAGLMGGALVTLLL